MTGRGSTRGIVVGGATGRLLGGLSLRQGTQGCVYGEGEVEVVGERRGSWCAARVSVIGVVAGVIGAAGRGRSWSGSRSRSRSRGTRSCMRAWGGMLRQRRVAGVQEVPWDGRHGCGLGSRYEAGSSSLFGGKIIVVLLAQCAPADSGERLLLLLLQGARGGWRCSAVT
jgi:hypothetical protein